MAIGELSLLLFWFRSIAMLSTGPTLQSPLLLITILTTVWGHSASEISRVDSFRTNWNRLTSEREFGRHVMDYSKSLTGYVLACSTHLTPISDCCESTGDSTVDLHSYILDQLMSSMSALLLLSLVISAKKVAFSVKTFHFVCWQAPLRSWKNRPAPFPGQMSYKATKPGSVCPLLAHVFECVFAVYLDHFL